MAHCNDKSCTKSSHYRGDLRVCDCTCETCASNNAEKVKAIAERGTCEKCGAKIGPSDEFCDACGAAVTDTARAGAIGRENDEMYERNQTAAKEAAKVSKASRIIGWMGVLFAGSGLLLSVMARDTARRALSNLSNYAAEEMVQIEGKTYKVADLRAKIESEPNQILILNLTLAAIMIGLFFWSKRSPLPAIATALAVYVGVIFISFLLEPVSLVQGIIVKIIVLAALTSGLRSALAARAAEQPAE